MSKIANVQYEILSLKKLLDSRDPELLNRLHFDLYSNAELANILKISSILYMDTGRLPSWDHLKAEIVNRVLQTDKQNFYLGLLQDIKDKDAADISTEDIIKNLKTQRQFRQILDSAGKLVGSVESRDANAAVDIMKELYQDMFYQDSQESLESSDLVNMAGKTTSIDWETTGYDSIDERGGICKGGLWYCLGAAKRGKSTLAQGMLTHAHEKYGGSSCYMSFEMSKIEVKSRILAAKSSTDIGLVISGLLSQTERLNLRKAEVDLLIGLTPNAEDFCEYTSQLNDAEFWAEAWQNFAPKDDRVYIIDDAGDWADTFTKMRLLATLKGVKRFVIDYPMLIPRASGPEFSKLSTWEYHLEMSKQLKSFARNTGTRIIAPAQYKEGEDKISFASNIINDCDGMIALYEDDGDKDYGEMGCVSVKFKAYRNYITIPSQPTLQPFKLLKELNYSRFANFNF